MAFHDSGTLFTETYQLLVLVYDDCIIVHQGSPHMLRARCRIKYKIVEPGLIRTIGLLDYNQGHIFSFLTTILL